MQDYTIILPSKPRIVSESDTKGAYEIENLYPGYGHTLGNSLRRIILSSLTGAAVTRVKIEGAAHEFSTIPGVKEDVINILLNLKQLRFKLHGEESQTVSLSVNKVGPVTAKDFVTPSQVEILDSDAVIANITDKSAKLEMELTVEGGVGYVPKEQLHQEKVPIGTIALDAVFTPIRRVNYEVENMRVGNRTDYNRLRIFLETDGVITPHEALERSIAIMIGQLKAIIGFKEIEVEVEADEKVAQVTDLEEGEPKQEDALKTRVEDVNFSVRTMRALSDASIRTLGGLARKKEEDLMSIPGLGEKGIAEIKRALGNLGIILKQ